MSLIHTASARPYAKAIFALALERQTLPVWANLLDIVGKVISLGSFRRCCLQASRSKQVAFMTCLAELGVSTVVSKEWENFLKLLVERRGWLWLPKIAELFASYYLKHNQIIQVQVKSAIALLREEKKWLEQALGTRLKAQLTCEYQIDPGLYAGLLICVGNRIIDNTLANKLSRLRIQLTS